MVILSGTCLCGGAHIHAEGDIVAAADCYCEHCRKSSGTSHCTHVALPDTAFTVEGNVSSFAHPAESGNIVTRSFCPQCGSALYSTNSAMPGMVFLRASCLDDLEAVAPNISVYTSRAPSWARLIPNAPQFETMPPQGDNPLD